MTQLRGRNRAGAELHSNLVMTLTVRPGHETLNPKFSWHRKRIIMDCIWSRNRENRQNLKISSCSLHCIAAISDAGLTKQAFHGLAVTRGEICPAHQPQAGRRTKPPIDRPAPTSFLIESALRVSRLTAGIHRGGLAC